MNRNRIQTKERAENRQVQVIRHFLLGLAFMILIFICGSSIRKLQVTAQTESTDFKYYGNVRIAYGDTLYSIAERYYSPVYYDDMEDYLREVCRTNHIDDRDQLSAGDYIIMPYYATYVAANPDTNN